MSATNDQPQLTPSRETSEDAPRPDKLDLIAGGDRVSEVAPRLPRGIRGARAAALQALYEEDLTGHPATKCLERLAALARLRSEHTKIALALVSHVSENRARLDRRIESVATEFPIDQISAIDRNVLRMALAELETRDDVNVAIVANEAVELARLFGAESTAKFVNGVLGALLG